MKHYYAANYPYGIACNANTGNLIRTIHRFPTPAACDEWVSQGNAYHTGPNHREALTAKQASPDIRRAGRRAPQGVPVWELGGCNGDQLV